MKLNNFSTGDRFSLELMLSDGTYSLVTYTSKISDFPLPNHIHISSPTTGDITAWIGRTVKLIFTKDNAIYTCEAKVVGQKSENNVFLALLKITTDFEKIQRRDYFRLKIKLRVYTTKHGAVKTVDISGSGLALRMEEKVEDNTIIEGVFKLETDQIRFKGEVIASELVQLADEIKYYIIRIKYIDINPHDQDKIVKFINYQQSVLRRKKAIF